MSHASIVGVFAHYQLSASDHADGTAIARIPKKRIGVRVRIKECPRERDVDGVSLDTLRPGSVCDVSATVGTWLIVQGYAYPEMRRMPEDGRTDRPRQSSGLSDRRRK